MNSARPAPLLTVAALRRTFGETTALASCSFEVRAGEIHALVGENGSGKSTLIKILGGVLRPDSGELTWQAHSGPFAHPKAAQTAGIATVYQETLLIDELSVGDNILLGLDGTIRRRGTARRQAELARAVLTNLGLAELELDTPVANLPLAQRQLITIARALVRPWRLLILDEATSALDIKDRDRLFAALARFRDDQRSILFVSHRMDEVKQIADRVTVLRSGRSVVTLCAGDASTERLLALMSTREEAQAAEGRAVRARPKSLGQPVLTASNLVLRFGRQPFDLWVASGEILGVAGLEGHGGAALLECLAGLAPAFGGTVAAEGHAIRCARDAAVAKVAFVPRERKRDGLFGALSVLDNLTFPSLPSFARLGVIRRRALAAMTTAAIADLRIKAAHRDVSITTLSGGNQQKVLLARWIVTKPIALILNDPLRGVDQSTKTDLYCVFRAHAASGMAIVFLSSELPELCYLCDRVAVFREGTLSAIIGKGALSERRLIDAMFEHAGGAEIAR